MLSPMEDETSYEPPEQHPSDDPTCYVQGRMTPTSSMDDGSSVDGSFHTIRES